MRWMQLPLTATFLFSDVGDGVADGADLLGVFVGDFDSESC